MIVSLQNSSTFIGSFSTEATVRWDELVCFLQCWKLPPCCDLMYGVWTDLSEGARLVQTGCLGAQSRTVCCLRGTPVSQRSLDGFAMSQPVSDGESSVSLQLRQNHEHLSERRIQRWTFNEFLMNRWSSVTFSQPDGWAAMCVAVNLCRGGMLSMALRLLRVDTTLKLSLQSHDTWRWCLGCLFSTMTMSPAQPWVR